MYQQHMFLKKKEMQIVYTLYLRDSFVIKFDFDKLVFAWSGSCMVVIWLFTAGASRSLSHPPRDSE